MPSQEFFRIAIEKRELSDEKWLELIQMRSSGVGYWLDRCTLQTLGRAVLFNYSPEGGIPRVQDNVCLEQCLNRESTVITNPGYSLETQGIFRPLQKVSPGERERLLGLERERLPRCLLGYTRNRKWIVVEATVDRVYGDYCLDKLEVKELEPVQIVKEYSIDYRRIWEFLGNTVLEWHKRKAEELEGLKRQEAEIRAEHELICALHGRVALWW